MLSALHNHAGMWAHRIRSAQSGRAGAWTGCEYKSIYSIDILLTHFLSLCLVDLADAAIRQDQNRHHLDTFAGGSGGCARLCAEHNKVPSWQIIQIAAQNRSKLFLSASQCRSQSYAQKGYSAAQDATTITSATL